jgi:hypothetical protein
MRSLHHLPSTLLLFLLPTLTTAQDNSTRALNEGNLSKRGLPYIYTSHSQSDASFFTSSNSPLTWYYNWSPNPSLPSQSHLTFVPMIHSIENLEDDIRTIQNLNLDDNDKYILVFNEPDGGTDGGGTDFSPEDAAEAWMEHIVPLREDGWRVSLPATTGSGYGLEWLSSFNSSCFDLADDGCEVDFLATHYYGDFPGVASWLGTLHEMYPDLEVWLTEFALPQADEEVTGAMLNQTLPYLDGLEYVVRYGWFGAFRAHDANEWTGDGVSLLDEDGGLTELGVVYLGGEGRGWEVGMEADGSNAGSRTGKMGWWALMVGGAICFAIS